VPDVSDVNHLGDLHGTYPLDPALPAQLDRDGFVRLPGVFAPETLDVFRPWLEAAARDSSMADVPMAKRSVYQRAFLQEHNLWQRYDEIRPLTFSPKLARIAAELLGADGSRLYHDQALIKEARGGRTPWHCDQYYWPVDSDRTITAWIPFVDVPMEMGPLRFSTGSHRVDLGRDVAIGDESDQAVHRHPRWRELPVDEQPFAVGDVSFHLGWTFHGAEPNQTDEHRLVHTVIYVADGVRLIEPRTDGQRLDQKIWIPDTEPGDIVDSWLNPVVWHRDGSHAGLLDRLPPVDGRMGTYDPARSR
jgi:ectoine hydroxylase-related dioxygenase (phytanoyl-CoA dioxygenase family)